MKQGIKKYSFLIILISVATVAVLLRVFCLEFVKISGNSMSPTLKDGQVICIWKLNYQPQRGDIVVIDYEGRPLVKRIIGLEGESVAIHAQTTYVDGCPLPEIYQFPTSGDYEVTVDKGAVFVMGDNRDQSNDSRIYGAFSEEMIRGKMLFTI